MNNKFFPQRPKRNPTVYAYEILDAKNRKGLLKVGFTSRNASKRSLKDVITQLEPALFKKVTGLSVKDFELLVSLNVFNSSLMNDAVYKFKRYEDASLEYIGINKHQDDDVGLYDTVISSDDYHEIFEN